MQVTGATRTARPNPAYLPIDSMSSSIQPFDIGASATRVPVGRGPLFLIAGPCVLESESHARMLAGALQRIAAGLHLPYIFKASYDKANRTSISSFRGPGLVEGCRILRAIAQDTGLPVLTDVHTPDDCARVSDALGDAGLVLQIPAFLCRQTDLLIAAAHTGRAINVKKGQFVAPADMKHAVQKIRDSGNERVFLTERGASFGYNNLVVDMRALPILRGFAPVVFDGTHSVQTPSAASAGGPEGQAVSGGQPEFIPVLARAAVAAGVDGLFLEVHDNPAQAKSDGANALRLDLLQPLLEQLLAIHAVVQPTAQAIQG
jgi:2-dehydro-3-deoxyphosphooctonate aldolase (KDO 8-P synthase)